MKGVLHNLLFFIVKIIIIYLFFELILRFLLLELTLRFSGEESSDNLCSAAKYIKYNKKNSHKNQIRIL
jgi:hypothetical protein